MSAEIYVFGIIMYLLLGSGKKQYWADGVGAKEKQTRVINSRGFKEKPLKIIIYFCDYLF